MKTKYSRLTMQERIQIEKHFDNGISASSIATLLGRDKSTVSRELRKTRYKSYSAYHAHLAAARVCMDKNYGRSKIRDNKQLYEFVVAHLRKKWSPEQISLYLKRIFQTKNTCG